MGIKYDGSMGSAAKKALQIGGVYPYKQYEKKKIKQEYDQELCMWWRISNECRGLSVKRVRI